MPWIDSLDWSSLNSLRRYPIREGCSVISIDENFRIPDNLITDITVCASSDVTKRFYFSKITNRISSVILELSDFSNTILGTVEINASTHTQDKDYYFNINKENYVGANVKITIGVLDSLINQPAGIFIFQPIATELEPRTIIPGLQGVDRIIFIDSEKKPYALTGDVTIITRDNLKFSEEDSDVYLDAGDDLGLNKKCALNNCVKTINGVTPNSLGDIGLLGINCLRVSNPVDYTIELEDTCCTPCSGCDELETLTERLTSLENNFLSLKDSYNNLDNQLTMYLATVNSNCAGT
jgi:hypothetical protein